MKDTTEPPATPAERASGVARCRTAVVVAAS